MIDATKQVTNEKLVTAMKNVNENPSATASANYIKELFLAHFLVPVEEINEDVKDGILQKDSEISLKMLTDKEKNSYFLAFTDWDELRAWSIEKEETLILTYGDIMAMLSKDDKNGEIKGAVINPFNENMLVTPEYLQYANLENTMQETSQKIAKETVQENINGEARITKFKAGKNNCYILSNDETAILIDTCTKKSRELIYNRIKDYPIKLIILTHAHYDHVENAKYFADKFGAKIAMAREDMDLLANPKAYPMTAQSFMGKYMLHGYKKAIRRYSVETFTPDIFLTDNFSLQEYGFDAKVVSLFGHTKGSIGVISSSGTAIVGDVLMNLAYPSAGVVNENHEMNKIAMQKLKDLGVKNIYTGHGEKFDDKVLDVLLK